MRHAKQEHWVLILLLLVTIAACSSPPNNNQISDQAALNTPAESETGTIAAGEFQLRYRIEGTGPTAIVIGSAIYLPRAFSENLRQHLRLVFMDHRGYAPSPGPMDASEFAPDKQLDDIGKARQELGLGRIIVMGHSIHSIMALEYAKRHPENVSHVVIIGSPVFNPASDQAMQAMALYWQEFASPERKAVMEENLKRLPNEELARLPPGQRFLRSYIRDAPRTWYDPRFDASALWEGVEANDDYMRVPGFRDIDLTQGLDAFDRPVFLAQGRYDFRVEPPSFWDPIRPKFRDLTVRIFEQSGHWPHYEEAALFDAELLGWMEERQ
ncbi:MAG: alpha/beta hydrolase [Ignavibacteria bacterium]|nr:alpha/beta hydrolase [Ignavibacteria bacterium]